jgi:hypothetical protein
MLSGAERSEVETPLTVDFKVRDSSITLGMTNGYLSKFHELEQIDEAGAEDAGANG